MNVKCSLFSKFLLILILIIFLFFGWLRYIYSICCVSLLDFEESLNCFNSHSFFFDIATKKAERLPNLSAGGVKFDIETGKLDVFLGSRVAAYSLANFNVAILRLCDVKYIVSNSDYKMIAVVFKKMENGSYERYEQIIGDIDRTTYEPKGVNFIDFSHYEFDGYVRIAISQKNKMNGVGSNNILFNRDKLLKNVFIVCHDQVTIRHAISPSEVFSENITTLCKLITNGVFSFNYVSPLSKNKKRIGILEPAFNSPSIGWYAGGFVANVPLVHVSWESYSTSVYNEWSRYYLARYNPADLSGAQSIMQQYGSRCNGMECFAYGWEEQYLTRGIIEKIYEKTVFTNDKFKVIENWEWNDIRIGDMLLWPGHVVIVTDTVSINGRLNSIEAIEFYPPYARYRTIFVGDGQPNDAIASEFSVNEPLNDLRVIARPDFNHVKRLKNVWNTSYSGFKPEFLMCDRGHNAVYTVQNKYVNMTVTDEAASSIIYTVNGGASKRIPLSDLQALTSKGNKRLYNIADYVISPGYYRLTLDTHKGKILESFYVPDTENISVSRKGNAFHISSPYKVAYAMAAYGTKPGGSRYRVTVAPELIVNNTINCERQLIYAGETLPLSYVIIVFKTDYGTFVYRSDGLATSASI